MSRSLLALLYAFPIALLGGLIGLGGAEFRLPVLTGPLRYSVRQAVPLNLAVSLVTLLVSLLSRVRTTPLSSLTPWTVPIVALLLGCMVGAYLGTALVGRISDRALERAVFLLLLGVGLLLLLEAFFPFTPSGRTLPSLPATLLGLTLGSGIGVFSSLLGVAGGELLIPTLLLVFGLNVKLAGTASVLISLPTVLVGILRYRASGAYRREDLREIVWPMGLGSTVGALLGGALLSIAPVALLKFGLGLILLASATKSLLESRRQHVKSS